MSKLASFTAVIILFLLLSAVVIFGFFIFTPKVKHYRTLNIDLLQKQEYLDKLESQFNRDYITLQSLQEREHKIDIAVHQQFDEQRFERFLAKYFKQFSLRSITSEREGDYQVDLIDVTALISTPAEFYHFIEALDHFDWVVEVVLPQQFKGVRTGIEAHFKLKVYTKSSQE